MTRLFTALSLVTLPVAAFAQDGGTMLATPMGVGGGAMGGNGASGPMGGYGLTGPMGTFGASGAMGTLGSSGPMGMGAGGGVASGGRASAVLGGVSTIGTGRAEGQDVSGASRLSGSFGSTIGSTVNTMPSRTVTGTAPVN